MLQVNLNNKLYELPMADLYKDRFVDCMSNGFIDFSKLDLEKKYKKIDELFGFVSRSFVVTLGSMAEEYEDMKYKAEIEDICRRITPIDRRQRFFHDNGKVEASINVIEDFVEQMLQVRSLVFAEEKERQGDLNVRR